MDGVYHLLQARNGRQVRRRILFTLGVSGAAALSTLGSPSLVAAAGSIPTRGSGRVVLVWRPWHNFPNGTGSTAVELMQAGIRPWLAQHPGVDVQVSTIAYQGATITAMLGGNAPDVFEDWVLPPYTTQGLIVDLAPYVHRDNVDLNIFVKGQLSFFQEVGSFATPGGLFCLPAYLHTVAQAVNLGVLDATGLKYPEPDWDYLAWTRLWEAVTVKKSSPSGKPPRAGAAFYWAGYDSHGGNPADFYWHGFGGGFVDPSNPTRCYLDAPGSIAMAEWCYGLLREGVLTTGGNLLNGNIVCQPRGSAGGLPYSAAAWRGIKWDFYPWPRWPVHRAVFSASDFYAIWAGTKYPELAWSLLKFLTVEPYWQRHMIRLALTGPNQKALWPEWADVVRTVAPPLRDKNLSVLVDAVQADEPYRGLVYRYSVPEVPEVINKYTGLAQTGQLAVAAALREAARQVNALEAAATQLQASQAQQQALVVQELRTPPGPNAHYRMPSTTGVGLPASEARARVVETAGTYKLLGDGTDVWNASNNCVFACLPVTATVGEWTCRVTLIANLTCPHLSQWAKIGLMAAADLSDDPAFVDLHITGAHQLQWQFRPIPGLTPGSLSGLRPDVAGKPVSTLTRPNRAPTTNYLFAPVWLKIRRSGGQWTPLASMDGQKWTSLSPPVEVRMAGCWVGVFACSHNASFGGKGYISASFDHLSFTPTHFVQVGASGVPPAAGPIPADWSHK